jgi:predicted nucleic acid-binding protein
LRWIPAAKDSENTGERAVITSYGVVLDTCVLVPATLCDILLSTADRGLYRPLWSAEILSELKRVLLRNAMSSEAVEYRQSQMVKSFPDATVSGYESLIPAMKNDPKDRHVLAAAIRGCAQTIVTANIKDFDKAVLDEFDICAITPDSFLMDLLAFDQAGVLDSIRDMSAQKTRPPRTELELLRRIGKSAPKFAAAALILLEQ